MSMTQRDISSEAGWLIKLQKQNLEAYEHSALLRLMQSDSIQVPTVQKRFLEGLQVWSHCFQRILMARAFFETHPSHKKIAWEHLAEELGHDELLKKHAHTGKPEEVFWDPLLDASATWFLERMIAGTSLERTILMHLVLEGSGDLFYQKATGVFHNNPYFELHADADEGHAEMGLDLVVPFQQTHQSLIKETLHKGWTMMTLLCDRLAAHAVTPGTCT